jgi:hypothetical protein
MQGFASQSADKKVNEGSIAYDMTAASQKRRQQQQSVTGGLHCTKIKR